jgi:hypothetical protein
VSNAPSEKLNVVPAVSSAGMSMLAWSDRRNDGGGIFAQNINADGTLGALSGVPEHRGEQPALFALDQNYPNPFNPRTEIGFRISDDGLVTLRVYDMLGREVVTLVNERKAPGTYSITWDARGVASGVYHLRLTSGSNNAVRELMLLR